MTFEGKVGSPLLDRLFHELVTDVVVAGDGSIWPELNVALEVLSRTKRSADPNVGIFYLGKAPARLSARLSVTQ